MNDGIYAELFAVKDGVRYNAKIVDLDEMITILASSLGEGITKLWEEPKPAEEPEPKCQHNWETLFYQYDHKNQLIITEHYCTKCGETMTHKRNP